MRNFEKPLQWGMSYEKFKKLFAEWNIPEDHIEENKVFLNEGPRGYMNTSLHTYYPGDCGVLLVKSANHATPEIVERMHQVATKCGFSKMFATVVGNSYEKAAQAFMNHPLWTCVHTGKSNRSNGYSDEWVLVYYNPDCEYKGH